jgi:hypothetical protein
VGAASLPPTFSKKNWGKRDVQSLIGRGAPSASHSVELTLRSAFRLSFWVHLYFHGHLWSTWFILDLYKCSQPHTVCFFQHLCSTQFVIVLTTLQYAQLACSYLRHLGQYYPSRVFLCKFRSIINESYTSLCKYITCVIYDESLLLRAELNDLGRPCSCWLGRDDVSKLRPQASLLFIP